MFGDVFRRVNGSKWENNEQYGRQAEVRFPGMPYLGWPIKF